MIRIFIILFRWVLRRSCRGIASFVRSCLGTLRTSFIRFKRYHPIITSTEFLIPCMITCSLLYRGYQHWGLPSNWDLHSIRGPVAQRVHGTIISVYDGYAKNGDDSIIEFHIPSGIRQYFDMGESNDGLYRLEVGDMVILNYNKTGDLLTFTDISSNSRFCTPNADCDY